MLLMTLPTTTFHASPLSPSKMPQRQHNQLNRRCLQQRQRQIKMRRARWIVIVGVLACASLFVDQLLIAKRLELVSVVPGASALPILSKKNSHQSRGHHQPNRRELHQCSSSLRYASAYPDHHSLQANAHPFITSTAHPTPTRNHERKAISIFIRSRKCSRLGKCSWTFPQWIRKRGRHDGADNKVPHVRRCCGHRSSHTTGHKSDHYPHGKDRRSARRICLRLLRLQTEARSLPASPSRPSKTKERIVRSALVLSFVLLMRCQPSWAAPFASRMSASATNTVEPSLQAASVASDTIVVNALGIRNLATAATMLTGLAVLPLWSSGLPSLARSLLLSASRCALQVSLLGSVVLQRIMGTSNPLFVLSWIVGVGCIASREALSRVQYDYPKLRRHIYSSVLAGGTTVLSLAMFLKVLGVIEPWFQPRTWIPVAGMLFGNTLSASALGISTLTKQFATRQDEVELRLARGASSGEATLPLIRDTFLTALTPTINGLAVTGIVHIPGMMTGQILAGQSPRQAAAYQIMINFLIAATACTTVQLVVRAAVGALIDRPNDRLRSGLLQWKGNDGQAPSASSSSTLTSSSSSSNVSDNDAADKHEEDGDTLPSTTPTTTLQAFALQKHEDSAKSTITSPSPATTPVLQAQNLHIHRANATASFQCQTGDRIGIVGKSGTGKSQLLRTLVGLEESGGTNGWVQLDGVNSHELSNTEFRTKVCFVSQNRPTIEGTPRMLMDEISRFQHHCRWKRHQQLLNKMVHSSSQHPSASKQGQSHQDHTEESPIDIITKWGMEEGTFDQPWSTLSGGEAQRMSLAIALSMQPRVLLLDESMSALDESTAKIVERTLIERAVPIMMVSHSRQQLDRFCTHCIRFN